eukprot:2209147-Prymnesium_polylepis.1
MAHGSGPPAVERPHVEPQGAAEGPGGQLSAGGWAAAARPRLTAARARARSRHRSTCGRYCG